MLQLEEVFLNLRDKVEQRLGTSAEEEREGTEAVSKMQELDTRLAGEVEKLQSSLEKAQHERATEIGQRLEQIQKLKGLFSKLMETTRGTKRE